MWVEPGGDGSRFGVCVIVVIVMADVRDERRNDYYRVRLCFVSLVVGASTVMSVETPPQPIACVVYSYLSFASHSVARFERICTLWHNTDKKMNLSSSETAVPDMHTVNHGTNLGIVGVGEHGSNRT